MTPLARPTALTDEERWSYDAASSVANRLARNNGLRIIVSDLMAIIRRLDARVGELETERIGDRPAPTKADVEAALRGGFRWLDDGSCDPIHGICRHPDYRAMARALLAVIERRA